MPLRLFALPGVAAANGASLLSSGAMFAWFVLSALYLQHVLGYDPLHVGLAFLPADLIMMAFSVGLSAQLVLRLGLRRPLIAGLLLQAAGLAWFARAPQAGSFIRDVLPGMALVGLGAGIAFNPLLLLAMSEVEESDSGLASGLVNTSFMLGGAFGLALLASFADAHTHELQQIGSGALAALNAGYHSAFVLAAALNAAASVCAALGTRRP